MKTRSWRNWVVPTVAAFGGLLTGYMLGMPGTRHGDANAERTCRAGQTMPDTGGPRSKAESIAVSRRELPDPLYASLDAAVEPGSPTGNAAPRVEGDQTPVRHVWRAVRDAPESDILPDGQRAYAILLQRARQIERDDLERAAQQQREREEAWRHTPDRDELLRRAETVDEEANARLAKLAEKYQLSEEQQLKVFPVLAFSSFAYHPALEAEIMTSGAGVTEGWATQGGSSLTDASAMATDPDMVDQNTVTEQIHEALDSEQQKALEDDWVDRDRWWTEIVSLLESDLDADVALILGSDEDSNDDTGAPPDTSDDPGDTGEDGVAEEYDSGGNIFDILP